MVQIKRAYEPAAPGDGHRVLVDRLWPRGVRKADLHIAAWPKELAPSTELRRWFDHDPGRWSEFVRRYRAELGKPPAKELLSELVRRAKTGKLTLVYGARDTEHNQAVVLAREIDRRIVRATRRAARHR